MTNDPYYPGGYGPPRGGQLPAFPHTRDWPPTPPEPPREVRLAFTLWISSVVLGGINTALTFGWGDPLAEARQRMHANATSQASRDQLDTIMNVALIIGLAFGVAFVALEVFFIVKMRAGRNWARIVLAVLAGFTVVSLPIAIIIDPRFGVAEAVSAIQFVLIVVATVFMFRTPANNYFSGHMHP